MRKLFAFLVLAISLITASLFVQPPMANAIIGNGNPAIYLVPHQDDETLTYGADIKANLANGNKVIVVMLTDGSESGYCYTKFAPNGDQTRDNGGLGPTNRAQCRDFRDNEFINAVTSVDASTSPGTLEYHFATNSLGKRYQDSCSDPAIAAKMTRVPCTASNTLTPTAVKNEAAKWLALYPTAAFKAMTYHESDHCTGCGNGTTGAGHSDHDASGEGLQLLQGVATNTNGIEDKRYFVKAPLWAYKSTWSATTTQHGNINGMIKAYKDFGWYSVKCDFAEQVSSAGSIPPNSAGDTPDSMCTLPEQIPDGADSFYHLPGK